MYDDIIASIAVVLALDDTPLQRGLGNSVSSSLQAGQRAGDAFARQFGMQAGRGHRMNNHGDVREVGIGVILGSNTVGANTLGPQLVTQNFASALPNNQAFVTGVAYYDVNAHNIFDPGEGIGGLTVARAIYDRLPHESTIYFGDTARVPYGPKSPETVRRYSMEILHWLLAQDACA